MQTPDTATAWEASVQATGTNAQVEARMVADAANPDGPTGPNLVLKVKTSCSDCQTGSFPAKQCDCPAGTKIDDSPDTISLSGCLLTCLAMGANVTPCEANVTLTDAGDIESSDGKINDIDESAVDLGMTKDGEDVIYNKSDEAGQATLAAKLCGHSLAVANVSKPGASHYVAVTGFKDDGTGKCRFTIDDPRCNNPGQFLDEYGPTSLVMLYK